MTAESEALQSAADALAQVSTTARQHFDEIPSKFQQIDQAVQQAQAGVDGYLNSVQNQIHPEFVKAKNFVAGFFCGLGQTPSISPASNAAGLVLWRMPKYDDGQRYNAMILNGTVSRARNGWSNTATAKLRIELGYDREIFAVDSGSGWEPTGFGIGFEIIEHDGRQYRIMTSIASGGGVFSFSGFCEPGGSPYNSSFSDNVRTDLCGLRVARAEDGTHYIRENESVYSNLLRAAWGYSV